MTVSPSCPSSLFQLTLKEPGRLEAERTRYAKAAGRALFSAAMMCAVRGTVLPYLIAKSPPGTFGAVDPGTIQWNSYWMAALFAAAALWASIDPLLPSITALTLYIALAIPDLLNAQGLLGKGVISKSVMLLILGRALVCGVLHRTLTARPSPD